MATQTRNPTSDFSFTGTWTGTPGSRFQAVDDHPDSGDPITDGLTHGTASSGEGLFGFTAFSIPAGSTNISLQVIYYDFKNGSPSCNLGGRIEVNGGTSFTTTTHNPGNGNSNIALRTDNWSTNPATTANWTVDEINGIGDNGIAALGVASVDANPSITISSIMFQVTYDPPGSDDTEFLARRIRRTQWGR